MKRFVMGAMLAMGVVGSAGTAFAQDRVIQEEDRVVYKQKTVVDFNDVTLEGQLAKPESTYMMNRRGSNFDSLIKLRQNFVPELQKSVDNL
ncbi:hypothetical protein [Vulgatibacter incomptus]|uniref:Uncharacterized protein n=1 Tax=Vulgatibacter incomptus TaxID=1391653 RepID=A0A0K1PAN7_9BACT|nr:hypothetical protein [Vulgatibacter incomptus]AKU90567.1 hypothetical protein AKJ08_0954 [Vulgatibacter incomptus]